MTVTAAFAQKDKSGIEYQNQRGPFVTNSFGDNWFISVGAGLNTWMRPKPITGEDIKGFDKGSYLFQVGVGKMLHPYYGVRGQFNYGKIKAGSSFPGEYTGPAVDGKYTINLNYWTAEADFLFHFSNAVGGYKEARFYNAILLAGVGYARSFGDDVNDARHHNNELAFNFGLLNTLRLAKALDFNAEFKFNILRQGFSSEVSAEGVGMIPSLTFGLTYKFNDRKFYTAKSAIDKAVGDAAKVYDGRIRTLENELAAAEALAAQNKAAADKHKADADKYKAASEKAPIINTVTETVTETIVQEVPLAVFFPIGKAQLTDFEMLNIHYAAEVIKRNPEKKYSIIGISDRGTGNARVNQELSQERAKVVYDALINKAGISPDQIEIKAMGDRINPFTLPEMNRVVIIE